MLKGKPVKIIVKKIMKMAGKKRRPDVQPS